MVGTLIAGDGDRLLTERGDAGWLLLGARLRPGVSRAQASAEIATIGAALAREFPGDSVSPPPLSRPDGVTVRERRDTDFVWSVEIASPIPYGLRILAAGFLALLMALVLVVLVIACVNISGVLLARATTRRREMAVRVATGAARGRLIQQLFTETVVLFLLGGLSGLLLARALTTVLVSLLPVFEVPIVLSVPLDARVVAFALGLSLVEALASGLAPALYASRSDVVSALKDDVQGTPERLWLRHAFLVAQVASSLLLIVTAGLLIRALDRVSTIDRGYDPAGVDAAGVQLAMGGYTETTGPRFAGLLLEKVRALPEVQSATLASRAPGPGSVNLGGVSVPGVRPPSGLELFYLSWTLVDSGEPVVILARQTAELFWPDQRAIGRFIMVHVSGFNVPGQAALRTVPRSGTERPQPPPPVAMRVVGVVGDVNVGGPPEMYVPLRQRYSSDLAILARRSEKESVAGELRALITSMDPNPPVLYAQTLASLRTGPVETQLRLAAVVAASVGIVGLLLAALGIYGVTAYAVSRRTREIGIRLSMGAGPADIVTMILSQSMTLIAAGTGIGLLLGVGAGRVLAARRFGVPPPDAGLLIASAALFTVVGLAASYAPVRRAVSVQAMDALRYE